MARAAGRIYGSEVGEARPRLTHRASRRVPNALARWSPSLVSGFISLCRSPQSSPAPPLTRVDWRLLAKCRAIADPRGAFPYKRLM